MGLLSLLRSLSKKGNQRYLENDGEKEKVEENEKDNTNGKTIKSTHAPLSTSLPSSSSSSYSSSSSDIVSITQQKKEPGLGSINFLEFYVEDEIVLFGNRKEPPRLIIPQIQPITFPSNLILNELVIGCEAKNRQGKKVEGKFFASHCIPKLPDAKLLEISQNQSKNQNQLSKEEIQYNRIITKEVIYEKNYLLLPSGLHKFEIVFIPKNNNRYISTSEFCMVEVLKRKPKVNWSWRKKQLVLKYLEKLPPDLFENISCELLPNVYGKGEFDFSHPVDILLEPGTHTLRVMYIPTVEEKRNFLMGYASIQVKVYGATIPINWEISNPIDNSKIDDSRYKTYIIKKEGVSLEGGEITKTKDLPYPVLINLEGEAYPLILELTYSTPLPEWFFSAAAELNIQGSFKYICVENERAKLERISGWEKREDEIIKISSETKFADESHLDDLPMENKMKDVEHVADESEDEDDAYAKEIEFKKKQERKMKNNSMLWIVNPGDILNAGEYFIEAYFSPLESRRYFPSSLTRGLRIIPSKTSLSWSPVFSMNEGDPLTPNILCAENTMGLTGKFIYNPPEGTPVSHATPRVQVKFIPDNLNYAPCFAETKIKILPKRTLNLLWFPIEDITYPSPLTEMELNATLIGLGSHEKGKFIYDPPLGAILPVGTHTLNVTFIADRPCYAHCLGTNTIRVTPSISRLIWNAADSILSGDALLENVLNCECVNAEGIITYNPPKGTILKPGSYVIVANFQPHDSHNYLPASMKFNLLVRERPKVSPKIVWNDPAGSPMLYGSSLTSDHLNARCLNLKGEFEFIPPLGSILDSGYHVLTAIFNAYDKSKCLETLTVHSSIIILKRDPVIVWEPSTVSLLYGTPLNRREVLNPYAIIDTVAKIRIEGEFQFDPPVGSVLNAGEHKLNCKFFPKDSVNYREAKMQVTIFIHRAVPKIIWNPPKEQLTYSETLTLSSFYPKVYVPMERDHILNLEEAVEAEDGFYSPLDDDRERAEEEERRINEKKGIKIITNTNNKLILSDDTKKRVKVKGRFEFNFNQYEKFLTGTHTLTCTFLPYDILNFLGAKASIKITILPFSPTIVWNPHRHLNYESPLNEINHLNAASDIKNGKFIYDPPAGTILPAGQNNVKVTFIPDDSLNYRTVEATRSFAVEPKMPILEWEYPLTLKYGTPLNKKHLCAKISRKENSLATLKNLLPYITPSNFIYDPPLGTLLNAGKNIELSVTFKPPPEITNYKQSTKYVTIEVTRSKPEIKWKPTLTTFIYGKRLMRKDHLNAFVVNSKIYKGYIEYIPPPGTRLEIGRHEVKAIFHPFDIENYSSATAIQSFQVIKRPAKIVMVVDPISGNMVSTKVEDTSEVVSDDEEDLEESPEDIKYKQLIANRIETERLAKEAEKRRIEEEEMLKIKLKEEEEKKKIKEERKKLKEEKRRIREEFKKKKEEEIRKKIEEGEEYFEEFGEEIDLVEEENEDSDEENTEEIIDLINQVNGLTEVFDDHLETIIE